MNASCLRRVYNLHCIFYFRIYFIIIIISCSRSIMSFLSLQFVLVTIFGIIGANDIHSGFNCVIMLVLFIGAWI